MSTHPSKDNAEETALVVFTPSGKRAQVPVGTRVLDAARQMGVDLDSVCGGRGICSKCQVQPALGDHAKHAISVAEDALSPFNAVEEKYDRLRGLKPGRRLGCQACVTGNVVLDVPPESQVHKQVVRKAATTRKIALDVAPRVVYLEVEPADMHRPEGDWQRMCAAFEAQTGDRLAAPDVAQINAVQKALQVGENTLTLVVYKDTADGPTGAAAAPVHLLRIDPGYAEPALFGVAVDLGSTTIAAHLTDLRSGEIRASGGVMNPQIRFGEDLMSRVSYAMMNDGGAAEMTVAVRAALDTLFKDLAAEAEIDPTEIVDVVAVMNPVMHHLLLGFDPIPLGQAPFALATSEALSIKAATLDVTLAPEARVHILPLIAGHVGADAAAVALSEAPQKSVDIMLIVDVGTNAEIILGNKSRVLACSSPTGPAFEGAQISAGQRAAPGAIERVEIDAETKTARFKIIGCDLWSDDPDFATRSAVTGVTGICGSGIIEAVAEMRMAGILDAAGLIGSAEQTGSPQCRADGRTHSYLIHDGQADGGPVIEVTQGDIRAIQLAKSALYAGARLLMDEFGCDQVDRVILAGAFGAHISPKHAMVLGMIPDCDLDRVTSAGNAAGTGAQIALLNCDARREVAQLVRDITKVETALAPRFQEHFVAANAIPHATDPYPILQQQVTLPQVAFNADPGGRGSRRRRRR